MKQIKKEIKMKQEYFSALNEEEAEKYLGKTMEFADRHQIKHEEIWKRGKFDGLAMKSTLCPFRDHGGLIWQFMRTCEETFQPEKRIFKAWVNVYQNGRAGGCHHSRKDADATCIIGRVACLHIKKEYEVEE